MLAPSRRHRESLASRLFPWLKRKPAFPSLVIHEPDFQFQIEKERSRADRRGIEFSLIKMGGSNQITEENSERLFESFQSRLRITDELGMIDGCLAILLPDTPGDGACNVAIELCEIAAVQEIKLVPRVFVYPDDFEKDVFDHHSHGESVNGHQNDNLLRDQIASNKLPGIILNKKVLPETDGPFVEDRTILSIEAQALKFSNPTPIWKSAFDFTAAVGGLIVFSPLLLGAACFIKCSSKGPVFFRQMRAGKDGQPFSIYKFRTMVEGAEEQKNSLWDANEQDGPAFKIENDPRLTKLGAILRKTCIDELPQLINVLRGEMSMVGPRPLPVDESQRCKKWQRRRLDVLPGMTCIWQVDGGRKVGFEDWMRMDLDYIKRRSVKFDLKLLVKTASVAFFAKGSV